MELREYQKEILERIRNSYRQGHNSPTLVLGCGGGKSCIAAEMAKLSTQKGKEVLFLVHRIELKEQIEDTFNWWGVDMNHCTIGMVQSISRRLDKIPVPDFIITDEGHHGLSNTYIKIYNHFSNAKRLFLSATPRRTSGEGLGQVSDDIIEGVPTKWLIENNFLSPFEYYSSVLIDCDKLKIKKGDYEQNSVLEEIDKTAVYGSVIDGYKRFCNGKKSIIFCSSIEHSRKTAEIFNQNNISTAHIDGKTQKIERKEIMDKFRSGDIQILCNYEIISEGLSVDDCEACLLLRPTKSLILFIQSSMRCMRYKENKTAIILDFVGNYTRFGLPDEDREWKLNYAKKKTGTQESAIAIRQCSNCFKVYNGNKAECPYCGHDNGKTKEQIKEEEQAELERIKQVEIYKRKQEVWQCKTYGELVEYGKSKGYKNAGFWASKIMESRKKKLTKK